MSQKLKNIYHQFMIKYQIYFSLYYFYKTFKITKYIIVNKIKMKYINKKLLIVNIQKNNKQKILKVNKIIKVFIFQI